MDKFAALTAFVAVVEEGGFAAAARRLGRSRSAINRIVITLADGLQAQLLNRTTRSVAPTAAARAFHERLESGGGMTFFNSRDLTAALWFVTAGSGLRVRWVGSEVPPAVSA